MKCERKTEKKRILKFAHTGETAKKLMRFELPNGSVFHVSLRTPGIVSIFFGSISQPTVISKENK